MQTKRALLQFFLTVLCVVALADSAAAQQRVRFILDWAFQGHQAPFTLSVDDGTFKKLGLDVTVDRGIGSGDTVAKVASGSYDIGFADVYSMVRFNAQNPDRKLIGVMMVHDKSALSVAVMKKSGLAKPADLNGKKIASPVGDASRQLFPLFATVNNIDQSKLNWQNISVELREPMLIRGEADAITGHLTTILMNLRGLNVPESDVIMMPYSDFGVPLYGHVLVVTPAYAQQNPETVRKFITGVVHGFNVMFRDPKAAVASVKKREPLIKDDVELARIELSNKSMFQTPNVKANGMSSVDKARLASSLEQVAKAFELKEVPKVEEVYVDTYLPSKEDLKVTF
jgi:NitT/TauT family transport system substrate-binding protein